MDRSGQPRLGTILPPSIRCAELVHNDQNNESAVLLPGEILHTKRMSASRLREFRAGRTCARTALGLLGVGPVPIPAGPRREPLWPAGTTGSITHCKGYCGAAVALTHQFSSVGIDAEPDLTLPPEITPMIGSELEFHRLSAQTKSNRVLFSAKESIFKAWYPLTRSPLGFRDVDVAPVRQDEFVGKLLVPAPSVNGRQLATFRGRYAIRDGFILTAVVVPRLG